MIKILKNNCNYSKAITKKLFFLQPHPRPLSFGEGSVRGEI